MRCAPKGLVRSYPECVPAEHLEAVDVAEDYAQLVNHVYDRADYDPFEFRSRTRGRLGLLGLDRCVHSSAERLDPAAPRVVGEARAAAEVALVARAFAAPRVVFLWRAAFWSESEREFP